MDTLFEAEKASPTSAHGKKAMKKLAWEHAKRSVRPALNDVLSMIDDDAKPEDVLKAVEGLQHYLKPQEADAATLDQIIAEVEFWAKQEIEGTRPKQDFVSFGIPSLDRDATPVESHEYVVIGARPSVGKSSFLTHIANHNLSRGLRVAYFTLETSANAVIKQVASQRAKANAKRLYQEMPDTQKRFMHELEILKKQEFRVFDRDLTMSQIESRCRALAASWKPQLVIIDYLGLIRGFDGSAYERMSQVSKCMIPLRKSLGCTLMLGAQLNRGVESENRAPRLSDFRDAGGVEEDASRAMFIHRPDKSIDGAPQPLGISLYDYELIQAKLRDGPLAHVRVKFHAPTTRFYEEAVR